MSTPHAGGLPPRALRRFTPTDWHPEHLTDPTPMDVLKGYHRWKSARANWAAEQGLDIDTDPGRDAFHELCVYADLQDGHHR